MKADYNNPRVVDELKAAPRFWQARVNKDWRFYFVIQNDTYIILDVVPHPK